MKKYLSLFFSLLFSLFAYSQQNKINNTSVADTLKSLTSSYQFQKALEYIEKQKPNRNLLIEKALCYKALSNYTKSCNVFFDLSNQFPQDVYILNELASSYQIFSNWQEAETCYNRLIEIDSTNIYFKIKKGDMMFHQKKYDKAIDSYRNIYTTYAIPSVLSLLGNSYEAANMLDSARLTYREAWEYNITDSQAAASYINISLKMKQNPVALYVCEKFIEQDTTNHQINRLHAFTYYMMDDYETAASLFEDCVANNDSSLLVNRSLGFSYYLLGDPRSFSYLEKAYAQDTTNNNVLYALAVVCNDNIKSEEAINYYTKLLDRVIPKSGQLYLYYRGLGTAYSDNEVYDKSILNYQKAIGYASENQQSHLLYSIANLYDYKLKDNENALKYYKLYRNNLQTYVTKLKNIPDAESEDVDEAEKKLEALDELILSMNEL